MPGAGRVSPTANQANVPPKKTMKSASAAHTTQTGVSFVLRGFTTVETSI